VVQFDLATGRGDLHVGRTMGEEGDGLIFINTMEKLTMSSPRDTLRVRLSAAMDGGIDASR
jgi:nitronate monooxygenase